MQDERTLRVSSEADGLRLDVFLARQLGLPRRFVWRLLDRQRIRLEGRLPAKGIALRAGQRVEVSSFRHPSEGPLEDPALPITVLAEGRGLLAVDKPAGIPSHPLDFEEIGTALGAVLALRPAVRSAGIAALECGLVHRLDTGTSGVLVFATDAAAWRRARAAFSERRVRKRYLARVHGVLRGPREIELRLAPRGPRVRVVSSGGRISLTRMRPFEPGADTSLIEVEPVTGLRHQIRAVLAHLGHPVIGDVIYGSPIRLNRHLLHAEWIELDSFEARAPVPREFGAALEPDSRQMQAAGGAARARPK